MEPRGPTSPSALTRGGSGGAPSPPASPSDVAAQMAEDMSRLLVATQDGSDEEDGGAAAWVEPPPEQVAEAAAREPSAAPAVLSPPRRAPALLPAQSAGDATAAFVTEVLTLVDADGIEELRELQQRTCVRRGAACGAARGACADAATRNAG